MTTVSRHLSPWFRPVSRAVLALFCHVHVIGRQNFPPAPYVVVSNHLHHLDALVAGVVSVEDTVGLVAKKYRGTVLGALVQVFTRPIWIEQATADHRALKAALKAYAEGLPLAIAPEGTRSRTGGLQKGQAGAAYLIRKLGATVVPVGITGTEHIFKRPRPQVRVQVGRPFRLPPPPASLEDDTARLMCAIAALLPPAYHGVYANHPFLEEMARLVC